MSFSDWLWCWRDISNAEAKDRLPPPLPLISPGRRIVNYRASLLCRKCYKKRASSSSSLRIVAALPTLIALYWVYWSDKAWRTAYWDNEIIRADVGFLYNGASRESAPAADMRRLEPVEFDCRLPRRRILQPATVVAWLPATLYLLTYVKFIILPSRGHVASRFVSHGHERIYFVWYDIYMMWLLRLLSGQ